MDPMRKTLILAATVSLCAAGAADAHARLITAVPKVGSTTAAPKQLRLNYSESIDLSGSNVKVAGPSGAGVPIGPLALDPKSKRTVVVPFTGMLGAGAYKVSWSMKTEDSHTTSGDFRFTVK
jgi:methionine-rich copper-binding protein CopC